MEQSRLIMYSLAYVVEDSIEDNPHIKVHPIEIISDHTGSTNEVATENINTKDINGNNINVIANKAMSITAKWVNFMEPNRLTAPNVKKGETVMLWKYAGDRYFWTTFYNELDLRTREKATYVFSNKSGIKDASKISQLYYYTIDTINKFIRLHTDSKDGEATSYDIEINTKEGLLTILDGEGNQIELNSVSGELTIDTNKAVTINSPNVTINTTTAILNATDTTITSDKVNIKSSVFNLDSGTINIKGKVNAN